MFLYNDHIIKLKHSTYGLRSSSFVIVSLFCRKITEKNKTFTQFSLMNFQVHFFFVFVRINLNRDDDDGGGVPMMSKINKKS